MAKVQTMFISKYGSIKVLKQVLNKIFISLFNEAQVEVKFYGIKYVDIMLKIGLHTTEWKFSYILNMRIIDKVLLIV